MQLEYYKAEIESKLSLLQNGIRPHFPGPSMFNNLWAKQRERKYEEELDDTNKRIEAWKPAKPVPCAEPSVLTIILARFGGDAFFYGVITALVLLFLHYIGLLGPLWWLLRHLVWLLKSIIYFFTNLHTLVS
jgi:hypothetical protein